MQTFHLHITGIVQGVGFRPFIYNLAIKNNLKGWVSNTIHGVHIEINASRQQAEEFLKQIKEEAPSISRIEKAGLTEVEGLEYHVFEIRDSQADGDPTLMITPDFALCETCRNELKAPENRRNNREKPVITALNATMNRLIRPLLKREFKV